MLKKLHLTLLIIRVKKFYYAVQLYWNVISGAVLNTWTIDSELKNLLLIITRKGIEQFFYLNWCLKLFITGSLYWKVCATPQKHDKWFNDWVLFFFFFFFKPSNFPAIFMLYSDFSVLILKKWYSFQGVKKKTEVLVPH